MGQLQTRHWKDIRMNGYEGMGENLLLAAEGHRQIATAIVQSVSAAMVRLREWIVKSYHSVSSPT